MVYLNIAIEKYFIFCTSSLKERQKLEQLVIPVLEVVQCE